MILSDIGKKIKELRKSRNISQDRLSKDIGISRNTLSETVKNSVSSHQK